MNAPTSTSGAGRACYVYGVVPGAAPLPQEAHGVGRPPSQVTLVRHRRVAALVSEIDSAGPLGTPDDLRAHAGVLNALAADRTPVLPFRFGGVVRGPEAVTDDLLGPFEERFADALDELRGLAQFTVRGTYRQERVLRAILADRPDLARLREETVRLSEDAGYDRRLRLGEAVAREMTARREEDGRILLDRLAPLAVAVSQSPSSDEQAVDASFLVADAGRADFEAAAEDLARAWSGRIDLRLLGPLAPYDFVAGIVDEAEEVL